MWPHSQAIERGCPCGPKLLVTKAVVTLGTTRVRLASHASNSAVLSLADELDGDAVESIKHPEAKASLRVGSLCDLCG